MGFAAKLIYIQIPKFDQNFQPFLTLMKGDIREFSDFSSNE